MHIDNCTKSDFDSILTTIKDFWGSDRTRHLHHPTLVVEFGDTAFVARENGALCGYLFGFYSQREPLAYAHLIAVHSGFRRSGVGKMLYGHYEEAARKKGCTHLKAITGLANRESVAFHQSLGFALTGPDIRDGIRYVKDYGGPGEDRVVFLKML